jgi:hypothetical protein
MSDSEQHYLTTDDLDQPLTLATGRRHVIHLPDTHRLHLRFDVDPNDPRTFDDRFVLEMTHAGTTYRQTKTLRDDQIPGDAFVDLVFEGCRPGATYTVIHDPGADGKPLVVLDSVPFAELFSG